MPPPGATYYPGQPISIQFLTPIDCSRLGHTARVIGWINVGMIDNQFTATPTQLKYVCTGSTINIAFDAVPWGTLVSRYVTVQVASVWDYGGNEMPVPLKWTFLVSPFDTDASASTVNNILVSSTCESLIAKYTSIKLLNDEISREVASLVNAAIDVILSPTVSAVSTGLQASSAVVLQLQTVSSQCRFSLRLIALPLLYGAAPSVYSPSTMAHYLQMAMPMPTTALSTKAALLYASPTKYGK